MTQPLTLRAYLALAATLLYTAVHQAGNLAWLTWLLRTRERGGLSTLGPDTVGHLATQATLTGLAAALLVFGGTWLALGRVVGPLHRLVQQARRA